MLERTGIYFHPGQSIISETGEYYKIIEYKGRGGNAIAFKVLCSSGENRGLLFALKVQYNLSSQIRRDRFFEETAFLKGCTHPAILNHIDDGTYQLPDQRTYPFVITNYLPETLSSYIGNDKIGFIRKVEVACKLLSALKFLQSRRLLHRDIKPNNIFISNNDIFLGDFGLMKKLNSDTETNFEDDIDLLNDSIFADVNDIEGYIAMPKLYRTPELVRYANHEDVLRIESDIFQLGLVLSELFTGENPLQEAENITAPITLNKIGSITGTEHSGLVFSLLRGMIEEDYKKRKSINDLLAAFTGLYEIITIEN